MIELASALAAGLTGEEGVQGRVAELLRQARQLESIDAASKPLAERLSSAAVELNDLGAEFSALSQQLQFDPEQAEELGSKMNTWLEVKRKHGGEVGAVVDRSRGHAPAARSAGRSRGHVVAAGKTNWGRARTAKKQAQALRVMREKAAKELAKVAAKGIAQLGFTKSGFSGAGRAAIAELGPTGDCSAEFLFSPNVGEAPLPLSRIASSGELARVMLALKTVLADLDDVPLLVFDEVDANVGGEIGRVVGEKMAGIARESPGALRHAPAAGRGAGDVSLGRDKGSVEGSRGGRDRADSGETKGAGERAGADARRSQREERAGARGGVAGAAALNAERKRHDPALRETFMPAPGKSACELKAELTDSRPTPFLLVPAGGNVATVFETPPFVQREIGDRDDHHLGNRESDQRDEAASVKP